MISRRIRIIAAVLFAFLAAFRAAATTFDTDLHHRILNTSEPSAPYLTRDTIMLSYAGSPGIQSVSMALEHERYGIFRTYEKNEHGIFVLTIPIPEGRDELRYRIVVDGLWTVDPNAQVEIDDRGIPVSCIALPVQSMAPHPGITRLEDGRTRFTYYGSAGSRVSVVGDFNRWDPFLTTMEESPVHPGVYSAVVRLPRNARFYRYIVDGTEIPDPGNDLSSSNGWGEVASIIPQHP
jgi:hypothetical protein